MEDWTGGLLCNPPFLRGGERGRAADWTLKWRGDVRKSKRSEQEWQNGL